MPELVIERELPGAGSPTADEVVSVLRSHDGRVTT
jgi:hypothetical protein